MNTKESDMQKTILVPPHPNELLANAVLRLANALDNPCGIAGVGPSCEAARDLVRDLAAPEHAEQPRPTPAPTWTLTCQGAALVLTDGRHQERWDVDHPWTARDMREILHAATGSDLARGTLADLAAGAKAEALAPSCDAPHCACETGEDCHANGAADDGDERVMVRAVSPGFPGPADRGTWVLDPDATGHRAPFARGDLLVRSSGREGIHQVTAVSVDVDAPRHRSLRLAVEPADVVVDRDAI